MEWDFLPQMLEMTTERMSATQPSTLEQTREREWAGPVRTLEPRWVMEWDYRPNTWEKMMDQKWAVPQRMSELASGGELDCPLQKLASTKDHK